MAGGALVDLANLGSVAYANGFSLWIYRCPEDARATLTTDGYFADASDQIANGDVLLCAAADGVAFLRITKANGAITAGAVNVF
jgi:hypothetical protein